MSQANTIPSPYNFVPMAKNVHFPEWQAISHDKPEHDGLSGTIEYTLKNHSPLLVGDKRTNDEKGEFVDFFETPGNQYAIPGTSIKGMIRNWLEIATHSRLNIMNDNWLSFRDLSNPEYRDLLTTKEGERQYKANSQAGWIKYIDGKWQLFSAQNWRVENALVKQVFGNKVIENRDRDSASIYKKLKGIQPVDFKGSEAKYHSHSEGNQLYYAKAESLTKNGQNGYLVVTGQVSSKKHMNFIFSNPASEALTYENDEVTRAFLDINQEKSDFIYLRKLNHQHGIPVFYIQQAEKVTQIGMAQMFRFPYKHSVGELRYDDHIDKEEKCLDFSQLLFGAVDEDINDDVSRKGRVSFSLAKCTDNSVKPITLKPMVLGAPRNSFYPAYIDQTDAKKAGKYNTYNQKESKLAGFKRYSVHKTMVTNFPPVPNNNFKVAVQLRPLPDQQEFKGKVRFHNLKPQELGALIFALQLGNRENTYHQLGMAKPYGLGKVKFETVDIKLSDSSGETVDSLNSGFQSYLIEKIKGQETLEQLLLLQNQTTFNSGELKYLDFPKGFVNTQKTKGKNTLPNLLEKAQEQAKKQAELQKQAIKKQKIAEQQAEQEALRNQITVVDDLIKNELGGEINKVAINLLSETPSIWKNLPEDDLNNLIRKIKIDHYYNSSNSKVRKKIRSKLGELGKKMV